MVAVIDTHRAVSGVEPLCAVLPIAPSTDSEQKARVADPARVPVRAPRDTPLRLDIGRVWRANHCAYGAQKVWKQ